MKMRCSVVVSAISIACCVATALFADDFAATTATVGRKGDTLMTPVNQIVTPAGKQIQLPGMRPNALALSPDGKLLVTSGLTSELVVVDTATGEITQHVPFPADIAKEEAAVSTAILGANEKAKLSFTGLAFSPDGSRIYLANVNGDIKVFSVGEDKKVSPVQSLAWNSMRRRARF
jgi:WD40 repeat protein